MDLAQTDEELWAAVVRGDGVAFAAVFDRHGDRVWRHAWRLMQHRQDTEDVVAAAFATAWRSRKRVRIVDASVLPWLLVTTTNCARNARRSLRRNERLIAHIPLGPDSPDTAEVAGDRLDRLDRLDAGSAVAQALRERERGGGRAARRDRHPRAARRAVGCDALTHIPADADCSAEHRGAVAPSAPC